MSVNVQTTINKRKLNLSLVLSILFMGLGHIYLGLATTKKKNSTKRSRTMDLKVVLFMKGVFFIVIEVIALLNIKAIGKALYSLITLGTVTGEKVMKNNDHSIFLMAEGLIVLLVVIILVCVYLYSINDVHKINNKLKFDKYFLQNQYTINGLINEAFPYFVLSPVFILIIFFVLFPLLFSCLLAFTNYSMPYHMPPKNLVDWVGFQNFVEMFSLPMWKDAFIGVFSWNIIWAFSVTFINFAVGLLISLMLYNKDIKFTKGFRTIFILPYAIPQMINLLIWRNLLNGRFGPINLTLQALGLIDQSIPFLSDPVLSKVSVILVNLWLGFPYFMLLLTGVLTSIPKDLYEAAEIDGASQVQKFLRITLPMVLFATAPLIVMSFSYNFNNFGAVYFLTGGGPSNIYPPGSGAGATDLLITWLFKLMESMQKYNMAAVLSLLVFTLIAPFAIYNFTKTKSFKEGEY